MINNHEDLCRALGGMYYPNDIERSERLVSHKVFHGSPCGAWVKFEEPKTEVTAWNTEEWTFVYRPIPPSREASLGVAIGPAGGWFLLDELPEDVVNYLRPEGRPPWSWDAMYSNLVPGRDSVLHVLRRAGLIVFRAKIDVGVREITTAGVTIGSRVEGSEAAPAPITLRYPVTLEEFKKVLAAVNAEAEALWYAANDCVSTSPVPE